MLTPDFAFLQEITLERWKGRGINADEFASPERMKCRVNFKRKIVWGTNNSSVISVGNVWFTTGTRIDVHDKLTFNGTSYKVLSCLPSYDISGKENHVEVEIQ